MILSLQDDDEIVAIAIDGHLKSKVTKDDIAVALCLGHRIRKVTRRECKILAITTQIPELLLIATGDPLWTIEEK